MALATVPPPPPALPKMTTSPSAKPSRPSLICKTVAYPFPHPRSQPRAPTNRAVLCSGALFGCSVRCTNAENVRKRAQRVSVTFVCGKMCRKCETFVKNNGCLNFRANFRATQNFRARHLWQSQNVSKVRYCHRFSALKFSGSTCLGVVANRKCVKSVILSSIFAF